MRHLAWMATLIVAGSPLVARADPEPLRFAGPDQVELSVLQRAGSQLMARLKAIGCENASVAVVDQGGPRLEVRLSEDRFAQWLRSGQLTGAGDSVAFGYVDVPTWAERARHPWPEAPPGSEWQSPSWPPGGDPILVRRAPRHAVTQRALHATAQGDRYLPIRDAAFGKGRQTAQCRIVLLLDGLVWEQPQTWMSVFGYDPPKTKPRTTSTAPPPAAAVGRFSLGRANPKNGNSSLTEAILLHPLGCSLALDPPAAPRASRECTLRYAPGVPWTDEQWTQAATALGARCRLVFGLERRCRVAIVGAPPAQKGTTPSPDGRSIELTLSREPHAGELLALDALSGVAGLLVELRALDQSPSAPTPTDPAGAPRIEPPELRAGCEWLEWRRLTQNDPERKVLARAQPRSAFRALVTPSGNLEPSQPILCGDCRSRTRGTAR